MHAAEAPLDSRRLATAAMAGGARPGAGWSGAQPPVRHLALEDLRQPAAERRRDRATHLADRGLAGPPWNARHLDRAGPGGHCLTVGLLHRHRTGASASRGVLAR